MRRGGCGWKADAQHAAAAAWAASLDACWDEGGHMARVMEIQEMLHQGLAASGGDANVLIRTTDGYDNATTNTLGISWSGTTVPGDAAFVTGTRKDSPATAPYRCIWTNELR